MELEEAQELFEQIVELCYELDNSRLIEVIESIYKDVIKAKDMFSLLSSIEELQIHINEMDATEEEQDTIQDILEKIEQMSE